MTRGQDTNACPANLSRFVELFGIHPRALALFRMALGLLLLVDLAIRVVDLRAMYTDEGILSVEGAKRFWGEGAWHWSLHWQSANLGPQVDLGLQVALFAVAAVFALTLLVGYRTRLSTIVSWLLLASLHVRMPMVLNAGDLMFRVLLFWAMFLPLGAVWSVDAWRRRDQPPDALRPVVSMATLAIMLQVCLIYWFTGAAKVNETWLGFKPDFQELLSDPSQLCLGGNALSYVCAQDMYGKPLARALLDYPTLLRLLSLGTVTLELIGPWLLFFPWGTRYLRLLLVASFVALHVGIELTIHVGLFSYVSLAAWILFVPVAIWSSRREPSLQPTRADEPDARARRAAKPLNPLVEAWRCAVGLVPFPRFIVSGIVACLLLAVIAWNISGELRRDYREAIREQLRPIMAMTGLNQTWGMYGEPVPRDWWLVYKAELRNGAVVDPFRGGAPVDLEKPVRSAAVYRNHRWRKMHRHLLSSNYQTYRPLVAQHVFRDWNERHGPQQQIVQLEMICLSHRIDQPEKKPTQKVYASIPARPAEKTRATSH